MLLDGSANINKSIGICSPDLILLVFMDNYYKNPFTPDEMLSILAALEGLYTTLEDKIIENITEKIKALSPKTRKLLTSSRQISQNSRYY